MGEKIKIERKLRNTPRVRTAWITQDDKVSGGQFRMHNGFPRMVGGRWASNDKETLIHRDVLHALVGRGPGAGKGFQLMVAMETELIPKGDPNA